MAFQEIEMNLTALESITPPTINITDSNVFNQIISSANNSTNDLLIFFSLGIVFIIMYLALSDKTPFQEFGYDDMRALNLSLSTVTLLGLTIISVGWSGNFYGVGMFGTSWFLTFLGIQIYENKE